MTGFGPRETWTTTVDPKGWRPPAGGVVAITWSTGTVEEYAFDSWGTKPAAPSAAAADA